MTSVPSSAIARKRGGACRHRRRGSCTLGRCRQRSPAGPGRRVASPHHTLRSPSGGNETLPRRHDKRCAIRSARDPFEHRDGRDRCYGFRTRVASSSSRVISTMVGRKPMLANSRCADWFPWAADRTTRGAPRVVRCVRTAFRSSRPTPRPRCSGLTMRSCRTPAGPRSDV